MTARSIILKNMAILTKHFSGDPEFQLEQREVDKLFDEIDEAQIWVEIER